MKKKIETKILHAGKIDENFGAVATPIYRSTTYRMNEKIYSLIKKYCKTEDLNYKMSDEELRELRYHIFYTRDANPNVALLQKKMASIEECDDCVASSSGMGAISSTLLSLIKGKKYIISTPHLYGITFSFIFNELREMFGVETVMLEDFLSGKCKIKEKDISAIYVESMSNPFLIIPPLDEIVEKRNEEFPDVPVIVDNTFLTPVNFKPFNILDNKKDVVIYSATKYLSGHSDVIAGIACGGLMRVNKIWEKILLYGSCLDAESAYYLERGLKTLHLRMECHNKNMYEVFEYLMSNSDKYDLKIFHPLAYKNIPDFAREIVEKRRLGGMITFNINGKSEKDGIKFMKILDENGVITHATSLGGVESLISMPYNSSQPTPKQQELIGLKKYKCLLRLSVGIENSEDIINSMEFAFKKICR
ncbi:MAG TPA: PLP-dependent transferase [Thermoplasmatales archaeon]|nr:PLP-dependent transferase [Thermoplasmatales archaeon]